MPPSRRPPSLSRRRGVVSLADFNAAMQARMRRIHAERDAVDQKTRESIAQARVAVSKGQATADERALVALADFFGEPGA